MSAQDTDRARDALQSLPPDLARDAWVKAGMAAHAAGLSFDDFDQWSSGADSYRAADCRSVWKSFKSTPGGVSAGALFGMARDAGWLEGNASPRPAPQRTTKPAEPPKATAKGNTAIEVWSRCTPATDRHAYAIKKQASAGAMAGVRELPAGDPLRIMGEPMAGALVVPCWAADGTLATLQLIPTPDVAARLKANGKPGKLNLPGHSVQGWFTVGKIEPDKPIYIVEGVATGWACWQSTGAAAVVTFGCGNTRRIVESLRQREPETRIVIAPDRGKEPDAKTIASEFSCAVACLPGTWPNNSDLNDVFCSPDGGFDVVANILEAATEPPISYPVSVAFADELPDRYDPPDELVEGVMTVGAGSVLYGDSNSGKTFAVIDMAAAVSRGVPWMGKRTEAGMVVYLAAESPASVRGRLQAYQKHHACKVPNFAIVQSPIDLFDGDADTNKVIQLVGQLEAQRKQKVRLIIGDTLARLSAGANENAGQDMGLVVQRFDRIRTECKAHFLLIHHCGKNAAAGSRGWSGVRAAVDTELEVTDSPTGRCLEITKQRDLGTKGERIGFRLDVVTLGHTKWGVPATSCVVMAADAPAKQTGKRMGECDGAVLEFLVGHKVGIKKTEVVKHFMGRYERGPIYRAMKGLVAAGAIHEAAGMVSAAEVSK